MSPAEYAVERMAMADLAVQALAQQYERLKKECERLRSRYGWLDHLDIEEGLRMHANEALLVENKRLKAKLAKLKEAT